MNNHKEEQLLKQMIEILAQESGETVSVKGKTPEELKAEWRGLVNVRQPKEASAEYIALEKEYLKEMIGGFYEKNNNDINFFSRD